MNLFAENPRAKKRESGPMHGHCIAFPFVRKKTGKNQGQAWLLRASQALSARAAAGKPRGLAQAVAAAHLREDLRHGGRAVADGCGFHNRFDGIRLAHHPGVGVPAVERPRGALQPYPHG